MFAYNFPEAVREYEEGRGRGSGAEEEKEEVANRQGDCIHYKSEASDSLLIWYIFATSQGPCALRGLLCTLAR